MSRAERECGAAKSLISTKTTFQDMKITSSMSEIKKKSSLDERLDSAVIATFIAL